MADKAFWGDLSEIGQWLTILLLLLYDGLLIVDDQAERIVLDEEGVVHGLENERLRESMHWVFIHL